jgi:hypothetical protein
MNCKGNCHQGDYDCPHPDECTTNWVESCLLVAATTLSALVSIAVLAWLFGAL